MFSGADVKQLFYVRTVARLWLSGYSAGVLTNIYCSESNVDAVNIFVDGNVDGNVDETLFQLFPDKFQ